MRYMRHVKSAGFTLVEVLVISPLIVLTIGTLIGAIIYFTGESLAARASNTITYQIQDTLNTIEQDIQLSGAFLATNNVPITAPQGYDNARHHFDSIWSPGNPGAKLILNAFSTTHNPQDPSRDLVYARDRPNSCDSIRVKQNQIYTYNIVYFVRDESLWRRVLMPANYATSSHACAPIWQNASCEPNTTITGQTHCRAYDRKMIDSIQPSDFTVQYYSSPTATMPSSGADSTSLSTRQAALDNSATAIINLKSTTKVAGRDIEQTGRVQSTRLSERVSYPPPSG